ncbi:MAG: RidA family protein [Pseudomonadota bacterium]
MTDWTDPRTDLTIRNPDGMFDPAPLAFSQLAILPPQAPVIMVAGQAGGSPKGPFAAQVRAALDGIRSAMEAAGGDMNGVARLTVYIVDHDETRHAALIDAVNAAFPERLVPTCTIVPLSQLGTDPDMLVEIEAMGVLPSDAAP